MQIDGPNLPRCVEAACAFHLPSTLPPRENKATGWRCPCDPCGQKSSATLRTMSGTRPPPQWVPGFGGDSCPPHSHVQCRHGLGEWSRATASPRLCRLLGAGRMCMGSALTGQEAGWLGLLSWFCPCLTLWSRHLQTLINFTQCPKYAYGLSYRGCHKQ